MVPHNEPGDRAFWCISDKCLNPDAAPAVGWGVRVQAGFYPAPSCPLLAIRLAGPRLIFVPPVHFSTIPIPQQLSVCVPTLPTDVGSRNRDRDGRGRCIVRWVGGRGASSPAGRGPGLGRDSGARPTAVRGRRHWCRRGCPGRQVGGLQMYAPPRQEYGKLSYAGAGSYTQIGAVPALCVTSGSG